MEKKELFEGIKAKKQMPVKQMVMGMILVFSMLLNVLFDYVSVGFDPTIYQTTAYWLRLLTTNAAVLIILFSVRGYCKEKELTTNESVQEIQAQIDMAHVHLNQSNLRTAFEDYVNEDNKRRKLKAYKNALLRKVARRWQTEKRRARLNALLERAEAEIDYRRVRYNKVRIIVIFSTTHISNDADEDLAFREGKDIGRMLLNKIINVIGFGILGASLTFESMAFAPAVLLTTAIKLFQAAYAIWAGASDGTTFVRGTVLSKMKQRLDYIQKFLEQRGKATVN